MSNINNQWVRENQSLVYRLLRDIEEHDMRGSYGGELDLRQIRLIIEAMFKEINRLQDNIELENINMKNLMAEIDDIKSKISGTCEEPTPTGKGKAKKR